VATARPFENDNMAALFSSAYRWPAPAKLNLFLHVTGRRADGYHRLQTVFQFLDYGDALQFAPRGDGRIRCEGAGGAIPDDSNLAVRAARLLSDASGCGLGADIRLIKRIPIGGGLGGGSSDAATTLVALNRLWNTGFAPDELETLGVRLGADVPVFLRAQASWAEGVGERLHPVDLPEPWFLVMTPNVEVSTAAVFGDPALRRDHEPVTEADFRAGRCGNDCEPVTRRLYPQVGEALDWLAQFGEARMSGTGASVFCAFPTESAAHEVARHASGRWPHFVARGLNRSPLADIMRGL
jgi:4-diphosphocytidyl-2-C-methyl-D-erythritol kinase